MFYKPTTQTHNTKHPECANLWCQFKAHLFYIKIDQEQQTRTAAAVKVWYDVHASQTASAICVCYVCEYVAAGTIQLNASVGNLSAQYLIANQPALTVRSSFFTSLVSHEIKGPSTSAPVSSQSANTSDPGAPDLIPTSSLLNSAAATTPTANQSTPMINQSAPLIISNTTVHIVDSVFDHNQHFDFGGLIAMNGAAVTVSNTRFSNLLGRVAGAALITSGSLVMFDEGTRLTGNAGTCLAGAVLVNADSALYLDNTTFANNQANGNRGGGAVLLYGNSTLHAVNSKFTQNAATAANLNSVDAADMAAGGTPSDVAVPTQWCGAVGGVAGIDTLYGIDDLASNHLLGSGEYIHILHAQRLGSQLF